jgi:thiamine-monophosphate kinase
LRSESELTRRLAALAPIPPGSPIELGIGDDCAIYRTPKEDLLFTADMLIEGVHFLRETHSARDVGHKALARSLSDIAAMGGLPRFCLVALCVPEWADDRWVDGFFKGLNALALETGTALAGGDLSHGEKLACDVTVCGTVPRGKALLRSGARPGDQIYVSGPLGRPWQRHLRPEPRLAAGRLIRETLHATAAIDLSDGLSLDLHRLCLASGVAAEIANPPRFRGASVEQALHEGESYELLFTLNPRVGRAGSPRAIGNRPERAKLVRIGTILKGPPGEVRHNGLLLPALGYDHFRQK